MERAWIFLTVFWVLAVLGVGVLGVGVSALVKVGQSLIVSGQLFLQEDQWLDPALLELSESSLEDDTFILRSKSLIVNQRSS